MAFADIERIGRELNGMFFAYGYGQNPPHCHPCRYTDQPEPSALMEEVETGMESLAVSLMDDLEWSRLLPPPSPAGGKTLSATPTHGTADTDGFCFEDWASRLIGTTGTAMDLDGAKCSAVMNSPQQPCKALR